MSYKEIFWYKRIIFWSYLRFFFFRRSDRDKVMTWKFCRKERLTTIENDGVLKHKIKTHMTKPCFRNTGS